MNNLKNKFALIYLIGLTVLLYFGYLGATDLWNPDEPRYVEVAREMFSFKNFLVPHLNGVIYGHKPPLFFWAIAGIVSLFGSFKEWVVRLVPALSGFFVVILTFFYASKIFSKKVGFYSAIILSSTISMMHLSRRCNIDTFFTLIILISFYLIHLGILNKEKRNFYFLISCFFQGLGVITKGPLAFIFPFFTLISYAFLTNDKDLLKKTPWVKGLLIILAVIGCWLIPAGIAGGKEYTEALIFKHTFSRYAHGMNHPRNFFYYFYMLPLNFMPWALFFPLIIFKGILNRKEKLNKNILWLISWFLINFIFMCFSTEKRGLYLLPLYPAISIISGYYMVKFFNNNKFSNLPFYFITGLIVIASIVFPFLYYYKLKEINVVLTVLSAISFWGGIFLIKYKSFFNKNAKFILLSLIWSLALFNVYAFFFPMANEYKSPKVFIQHLNKYETNWDKVVFFNFYHAGFNFYLQRNVVYHTRDINELKKFLKKDIKVVVVKKNSEQYILPLLKKHKFKYKETRELGHRLLAIYKK